MMRLSPVLKEKYVDDETKILELQFDGMYAALAVLKYVALLLSILAGYLFLKVPLSLISRNKSAVVSVNCFSSFLAVSGSKYILACAIIVRGIAIAWGFTGQSKCRFEVP